MPGCTACGKGFTCPCDETAPMAWTVAGEGVVHVGGGEHVAIGDEAAHKGGGKLG